VTLTARDPEGCDGVAVGVGGGVGGGEVGGSELVCANGVHVADWG
jgi:hypothetical protein